MPIITRRDWFEKLKEARVKIWMDGKGRWIDNRINERLWRSLKYHCGLPERIRGRATNAQQYCPMAGLLQRREAPSHQWHLEVHA